MHDRKKIDAQGHWRSVKVNVEFCLQLIAPKPRGGAGEVSCKIFFNLSWIYQLVFLDFLFFYCCSNHWCNKHINQLLKDIKPLEEREVGTFSIPDFSHFTPDLQQKLVVEVWGFLLFFFFSGSLWKNWLSSEMGPSNWMHTFSKFWKWAMSNNRAGTEMLHCHLSNAGTYLCGVFFWREWKLGKWDTCFGGHGLLSLTLWGDWYFNCRWRVPYWLNK